MNDPRVDKLADMLVNYSVGIKPGDKAMIEGNELAKPLVTAIYKKVLQAGGLPYLILTFTGIEEVFYSVASDEQLQYIHDPTVMVDTFDADFYIQSDANTKRLTTFDPEQILKYRRGRQHMMDHYYERAGRGEMHWVYTLFPTEGHAQDAEMSLEEYTDFV